jgi:hypothetical protein
VEVEMAAESFALVKVVDRLIDLAKHKIASRKEMFEKILEPTFNELQAVHGNYLEIFVETEALLSDLEQGHMQDQRFKEKLASAIRTLKERRTKFEPARVKLKNFSTALAKQKLPPEEMELVYAFFRYFHIVYAAEPSTTVGTMLVQQLETCLKVDGSDSEHELQLAERFLTGTVVEIKSRWSKICQNFASVKIKVTSLH